MSFIIGNKCVGVCDTACVAVCPVACINGPIEIDGEGWEVADMTEEQLKNFTIEKLGSPQDSQYVDAQNLLLTKIRS